MDSFAARQTSAKAVMSVIGDRATIRFAQDAVCEIRIPISERRNRLNRFFSSSQIERSLKSKKYSNNVLGCTPNIPFSLFTTLIALVVSILFKYGQLIINLDSAKKIICATLMEKVVRLTKE